MEEWRDIPGYEGLYQVSNLGQVRKMLIRKSHLDNRGRPRMILSKNGETTNFPLSNLVAAAFHGPRPEGQYVCHGDGNPKNNQASNLRYDTPKANSADRELHGRTVRGEAQPLSKLTEAQVRSIREAFKTGARQMELAQKYGVSQSLISAITRGEIWSHV